MSVSLEARINTISDDLRIALSDIQAGKLVDLAPLESKIKDVCLAVSNKKKQPLVADPGTLLRQFRTLMVGFEYLEKQVTAKKEGLVPPKSSLGTP